MGENKLSFINKVKNELKQYFKTSKKYLIVAFIVAVIIVILGYVFAADLSVFFDSAAQMGGESETVFSIFTNNFAIALGMIFGGALLSIPSLFFFGSSSFLFVGYCMMLYGPVMFWIIVAPHGIFEISSFVIALAGALMLTHVEVRIIKAALNKEKSVKDELNNSHDLIKAVGMTVIICFILLAIAAFIETYITGYYAIVILSLMS